jgi:hypothetical protein
MAVNRIDPTPLRLDTKVTEARQTPNDSFGQRIQNGAAAAGNVVASGAAVAAPFVPGGAIVSAAVSGVSTMANSASSGQSTVGAGTVGASFATGMGGATVPSVGTGSSGGAAGGVPLNSGTDSSAAAFQSTLQQQQAANMQYLELQNQMQQENQVFSTLSNVLKVRHDTAKNSISNIH